MGNDISLIENMNEFKKVKINDYFMFSLPKVGTTTIKKLLDSNKLYLNKESSHDILKLKYYLENSKNNLFIAGMRNPFEIIYSSYFELFWKPQVNVKTFKHPDGYITPILCDFNEIDNYTDQEIATDFINRTDLFTYFIDFMNDFFLVTEINKIPFNKEKGLQLYKLKNNNYLLVYILEKINKNNDEILDILKIKIKQQIPFANYTIGKVYSNKYLSVKRKIKYNKSYVDYILNTAVVKYFYSNNDIKIMRQNILQ